MAGIYIHIPFCKQACHYCNFHFSTSLRHRAEMIDAICKEIDLQKEFLDEKELTSIYFGGGTPSLLAPYEIEKILDRLSTYYTWQQGTEITLEANPDDITSDKISQLHAAGINRLSVGIQSFLENELLFSNRAHTATESLDAIKICQDAGINNLSIDLIYGMPDSSTSSWQYNIDKALELDVDHISSYALTVEANTALDSMVRKGKVSLPDESIVSSQYLQLIDELTNNGYDHYEISNFAKPQKYAVHNTSYWQSVPYLGLGPSAHSFKESFRQWNISNNANYLKDISQGIVPFEREITSLGDQFNEYIMTRLRTMWGINIDEIKIKYADQVNRVHAILNDYKNSDYIIHQNNHYKLTPKGRLLADRIASDLFVVEGEI